MFKNKGLKYKEIILDRSESQDFQRIENKLKKMFPNQKIEKNIFSLILILELIIF